MKTDELFEDEIARRIWVQFLNRVHRVCRPLDEGQRHDLILELQDHLLASFREEPGENEASRLLNAIEKIGEPEIFLKPMLADRFIVRAGRTFSPKAILQALYYSAYRGVSMVIVSILIGLGYLAVFALAMMALLKPVFPQYIGILFFENGGMVFGFTFGNNSIAADPLGYWIVPLGLAVAALLYFGLIKLMPVLRKTTTI